jgi:hypothetical protein
MYTFNRVCPDNVSFLHWFCCPCGHVTPWPFITAASSLL